MVPKVLALFNSVSRLLVQYRASNLSQNLTHFPRRDDIEFVVALLNVLSESKRFSGSGRLVEIYEKIGLRSLLTFICWPLPEQRLCN